MALTITGVPDTRQYIGPSMISKIVQCTPSVSDYPAGGWPVTAEQLDFGNGYLYGAVLLNETYVASSAPSFKVNLPSSSYGANPQPSVTQVNVSAYVTGTTLYSNAPEAPVSTDFSAYSFWLMVYGY